MTRLALVLAAVSTCSVALAETIAPPTPVTAESARRKDRREASMQWWLWSAAAALAAGAVVTSVVVATRPHESLNVAAMGLTVRF